MLGSMSWLPLEKRHLKKRCVEVVKRRRDEYVGNGQNLFGVQNREDSGAGQRTAGIWQALRATWQKRESAENSATQAVTKEEKSSVPPAGEELLKEATADQHWLAVGHDYHDEAASVGRSVSDGVLFKIAVNISGQKLTALIDSGASRCYIAPEIAATCELYLEKEKLHLELADGSKVQSAHKAPNVPIVVGKTVCKVDFTVTQLLFGVDLVLGINWLALWNPVIDWTSQKMNIWTGREWNQIQGLLLKSEYNTGTVKDFVYCGVEKTDTIPDFIKMKEPKFWDYDTGKNKEWKRIGESTAKLVRYPSSQVKSNCPIQEYGIYNKRRQPDSGKLFRPSKSRKDEAILYCTGSRPRMYGIPRIWYLVYG